MTKTKTKQRRRPGRPTAPAAASVAREQRWRFPAWSYPLAATIVLSAIGAGAFWLGKDRATSSPQGPATSSGLPSTLDYHSLLVAPSDPNRIFLGTHDGLYESRDGGHVWRKLALDDEDTMNLARADEETVWTAGHNVFAKSTDGGITWTDVRPDGLPSLDIHGFAVAPRNVDRLYAAVAGKGLYRSDDGGSSFELVSDGVGGAIYALAALSDGRLLAGDQSMGLLASADGGESWTPLLRAGILGLAVNPVDPATIVAAGPGILVSTDGGENWREALTVPEGACPVAWSPSDPDVAYVVGFDRVFYRTGDRGRTWQAVT